MVKSMCNLLAFLLLFAFVDWSHRFEPIYTTIIQSIIQAQSQWQPSDPSLFQPFKYIVFRTIRASILLESRNHPVPYLQMIPKHLAVGYVLLNGSTVFGIFSHV